MKVTFLTAKDVLNGSGGIETYTLEVGRRLVARGHTATVYSTWGEGERPSVWEGVTLRWLPRIKPFWAEKMTGCLTAAGLSAISRDRPDIFHLHSVAAGAMAPLLRRHRAPCILQMHGVEWQRSRWGSVAKGTLRFLEKVSFANATAITAVSRAQCEFYSQDFHRPISLIPTGTNVHSSRAPEHLADLHLTAKKYFLTAVRLVREKGVHNLITAFRKLSTDWALVIAGGSNDKSYVQYLHSLAAKDPRIRFMGHVREPILGELYSHAGAYVQASEIEGMSISLLDAMSYGCCCIVSDIPENIDVLGSAGISFRSRDTDDLASNLSRAIGLESAATRLGQLARERVQSEFSWDAVTDRLEALYLDTLERHTLATSRQYSYSSPRTYTKAVRRNLP